MDSSESEHLPEHPIGTLIIVLIYGLLLAASWTAVYVWALFGRGAPSL